MVYEKKSIEKHTNQIIARQLDLAATFLGFIHTCVFCPCRVSKAWRVIDDMDTPGSVKITGKTYKYFKLLKQNRYIGEFDSKVMIRQAG